MEKSIQQKITKLNEIIEESKKELNTVFSLIKEFPDLEIKQTRWKKELYFSKSVNNKVNKYEEYFSCGCCDDAPLFVRPYIEVNGIKVYSNPTDFYIGDKSYYNESGVNYDLSS